MNIIIPSNKELIYKLVDKVDGFILPVNNLSINYPTYFNLDEILILIDYLNSKNKVIFISLNKNMHNKDLDYLKRVLTKLDNYTITGVLYYDISIVNLKDKLKLHYDLVWNQEHMTTNYMTINYWYNKGVKYTFLSNEITKNEIEIIKQNTSSKLLLTLFGYIPIFTSKRHLVDNYIDTFNLKCDKKNLVMNVEDKDYPVVDDKLGTVVYNNNIINGLNDIDIDYKVFNSFRIDDETFIKVIDLYNSKKYDEINSLFNNIDKCFLYKETVYKVK